MCISSRGYINSAFLNMKLTKEHLAWTAESLIFQLYVFFISKMDIFFLLKRQKHSLDSFFLFFGVEHSVELVD